MNIIKQKFIFNPRGDGMVGFREFLSGLIAGFLNLFVTPFIIGFIPSFPFSYYVTQPLMFGIWVVIVSAILERTMV